MPGTTAPHWTPDAIPSQHGRTALITGGNSGIGLETARVLARHGARVLLAGRSAGKLEEAAAALRDERPGADVGTVVLDLGSLASIRRASADIAGSGTVDLLVNNAGVMNVPERRTTADGFELTFGTNHLGHFALTAGLMPALRRSPAARIVTVSALAAAWRGGRLDDLMSERRYAPMTAYAKSKRANVVFTLELARRLEGTAVEAVAVHPGSAVTNLQRHSRGPLMKAVVGLLAHTVMGSPEGAAWPTLYAATAADVRGVRYLGPAGRDQTAGAPKEARLPRGADDPAEGALLWETSERLTGVNFPT
ncbi:oxidoreductase [Streptomyces sp. NPDC026672]|uniref:oxidoreductase n=1 Tax=unclassified Streptomyces TaxID=2593676 RepID=UPI0033EB6AA1